MKTAASLPPSSPSGTTPSSRGAIAVFFVFAGATGAGAPWLLGGETVTTEWWLLGGAALTFIFGALKGGRARLQGEAIPAWRSLRWPVVLGLIFLFLLGIQALNPSHRVVLENRLWRLDPLSPVEWAPKSLVAPFETPVGDVLPYRNTARYLLIFGTTWLYATGLALGLTRARDARRFARLLGINAALLAAVCIVHVATGAQLTLWRFYGTFDFSHSPVFLYKNHNGAYLAASLAVVLGLAMAAKSGRVRRTWELVGLGVWVATLMVDSRVATACATILAVVYFALGLKRQSGSQRRWRLAGVFVALIVAGGVLFTLRDTPAVKRFAPLLSDPIDFLQGGEFRVMLREVGYEMWTDRPVWGWGGGSFLYLFNNYHHRVPELAKLIYSQQPLLNRFYWPTANCDWVEFAAEYGGVGLLLLTGIASTSAMAWWRARRCDDGLGFFLMAGTGAMALHGFFDYVLRNPAIMLLFATLTVVVVSLVENKSPAAADG